MRTVPYDYQIFRFAGPAIYYLHGGPGEGIIYVGQSRNPNSRIVGGHYDKAWHSARIMHVPSGVVDLCESIEILHWQPRHNKDYGNLPRLAMALRNIFGVDPDIEDIADNADQYEILSRCFGKDGSMSMSADGVSFEFCRLKCIDAGADDERLDCLRQFLNSQVPSRKKVMSR